MPGMVNVKFRRADNPKTVDKITESGRGCPEPVYCDAFFFQLAWVLSVEVGPCFTLYFMCASHNSSTVKVI